MSQQFSSTYTALVSTLFETFGDEKLRELHEKVCKGKNQEFIESVILQWNQDILPVKSKINNRDPSIFIDNISVLNDLNLPSLWISNKLSVNSKNYLWVYLGTLTSTAEIHNKNQEKLDIKPPDLGNKNLINGLSGIQEIYENMSPNILDKVKNLADEFGQKIESGETSLSDLNFSDISQKLFADISPDDIQNMMSSVSGLLQNLNLGAPNAPPTENS
jgi:hypothetical protein